MFWRVFTRRGPQPSVSANSKISGEHLHGVDAVMFRIHTTRLETASLLFEAPKPSTAVTELRACSGNFNILHHHSYREVLLPWLGVLRR